MKTRSGNNYEYGIKTLSSKMDIDKIKKKKNCKGIKSNNEEFDCLINLFSKKLFINEVSEIKEDNSFEFIINNFDKLCSLKTVKKKKRNILCWVKKRKKRKKRKKKKNKKN